MEREQCSFSTTPKENTLSLFQWENGLLKCDFNFCDDLLHCCMNPFNLVDLGM